MGQRVLFLLLSLWLLAATIVCGQAPGGASAPLEYLPNRGQWPAPVRLRADVAPGLRVFAEDQRLTFLRYDAAAWAAWAHEQSHDANRRGAGQGQVPQPATVNAHAWAVAFVNARATARPQPEGPPTGPVRNYLFGPSPTHWATNIHGTAAARYADLWPGIDLRLHASAEGDFEYDLELKPGADPTRIGLQYEGLEAVRLDAKTGHLRLQTALGEMTEAAPVAWQTDAKGERRAVPIRFDLKPGKHQTTQIGFALPAGYDHSRPLTIDPVLVFATHSGSTAPVFGHTATYDNFGHLYAAGPCYDVGYPTTLGAFDLIHSNGTPQFNYANPDVAISRYAPDGRTLRYATYLGGTAPDYPHSLLVNGRGELLILGTTQSANFPTTVAAYDTSFNNAAGLFDLFVAKLDSTGSRLLSSTYLGGQQNDGYTDQTLQFFYGDGFRGDLEVDTLDRVYVATTTASADFPFTSGAVRPATGFRLTAVVARFSADLHRLDWASGLGTMAAAYSLHLPATGAPYVVGTTLSAGFPTTAGTLTPDSTRSVALRQRDGFIAQLSPNGDSVRQATYLRPGTAGQPASQTFFVQGVPGSADVVVLGSSTGRYPISAGKWGQANGGLVMQRLSPNLRQRRWATTIGHPVTVAGTVGVQSDNVSPTAFLIDRCGALYVSAWGNTRGLTTTNNALQRTTDGQDLYMLVLDPDARALQYATYLGGNSTNNWAEEHVDGGTSRFDPQGRVYQAICTNSANFPTTPGSWSPNIQVANDQYDEVSVKLDFERRLVQAVAAALDAGGGDPNHLQLPATVQFVNRSTTFPGTTYQWLFGDGTAPSAAFAPQHTYTRTGTYTATLIVRDAASCAGADTTRLTLTVHRPDTAATRTYAICRGDSVRFSGVQLTAGSFAWTPAESLSDSTIRNPWASPDTTTTYTAFGTLPGSTQRITWTVTVTVRERLQAAASATAVGGGPASGQPAPAAVQFVNTTRRLANMAWRWDFGDGSAISTALAPQHTYTRAGTFPVTLIARSLAACNLADTVRLTITVNRPDTIAATAYAICRGDSVRFAGVLLEPGSFTWSAATTLSSDTITNPWASPDTTTTYTATGVLPSSTQRVTWTVTVTVRERLQAAASATAVGGGPASGQPAPANVQFVNSTTTIPGTTWQWNFGDGSAPDPSFAPLHTYTRAGTFPMVLIATSPNACNAADTVRLTITVNRPDTIAATAYAICRGDSVRFAGVLLEPGSFTWSAATTLSSDTITNPWASPDTTTTYTATGVLPGSTQRVTWTVTVTVRERLQAAASATAVGGGPASGQPAPAAVQFVNSTTTIPGTTWQWNFGDGSAPDPSFAPLHTYTRVGTFPVVMIASSADACNAADTVRLTITVNRPDTIAATAYAICRGDSVRFAGVLLEPGSFTWSAATTLSSDTITNPWASPDTTTTYTAFGLLPGSTQRVTWTVTVTVRERLMATASATAVGGGPASGQPAPATVQFVNATTTIPGTTWQWNFGDGSAPDPSFAPLHTYTRAGTFPVVLIATSPNACNAADTVRLTITVNRPDTIAATAYAICRGDSVRFAGVLLEPGSFAWSAATTLSNDTITDPWASPDTTTTYTAFGTLPGSTQRITWTVTVTVRERLMAAASATAVGGGPASGQPAPATVQFVNSTASLPGVSWQWNFGDGSAADTAASPRHAYLRAGTFTAVLTARSPASCNGSDTIRLAIVVNPADTTAVQTYTICPGDSVQFGGLALEPGTFRWSPDSTLSSATAPAPWAQPHRTTTYEAFGQVAGQVRRATLRVTVVVRDVMPPTLTTEQRCLPGGATATFRLSAPLQSAVWDFGDGSPASAPTNDASITHTYALTGPAQTYPLTVRGRDANGCPVIVRQEYQAEALLMTNVLTPADADGLNDTFQIPCFEPGTATLQVFNRWGRSVYDSGTNRYANDWSAPDLPAGTYYYTLRLTYAPQEYRGWVEVIR